MTLNITVGASWLMAQSSDFRLTHEVIDTKTGQKQVVIDSEVSQKQVVLHYIGWSGLICYTGVAKYGSHDTALWLEKVLGHDGGQRSPAQIVSLLIEEGSVWLRKIPAEHRRHTFTMITYEKAKPHIYVISNFERPDQPQLPTPADALFCTRIRPKGPRCVVTGQASAVTGEQRRALRDVLAHKPPPEDLRQAVAQSNVEASARAQGKVSESCIVAHLYPDGSGEAQVFGDPLQEFVPAMFIDGHNVSTHVPYGTDDADEGGPQRLVGVTWEANRNETNDAVPWTVMTAASRGVSN